jgi:hypothetical protein
MSSKAGNVLPPGTFELEFLGIRLHGNASDLADDMQHRVAVHEFDRVDGAATEWMRRGPLICRVTLIWIDAEGLKDAGAFLSKLAENPSGLLIHPIHGKRQATCSGFQGARLTVAEANTYTMPVTFTENNVNPETIGQNNQGVPAKSAAVQSQSSAVTGLADF